VRGSRTKDLVQAFEGAFGRRGWHGPGVLGSLRGAGPKEAGKRPKGAHHSIHDLVEHIAFWEERGIRYIRPEHPRSRGDWETPGRSFAQSLAHMKGVHARLVASIRSLHDADLDRIVTTGEGRMSLSKALYGITAHAAYHAGQIRLLRTLL
jgi:uncharacterized damage-inducible protein DinB